MSQYEITIDPTGTATLTEKAISARLSLDQFKEMLGLDNSLPVFSTGVLPKNTAFYTAFESYAYYAIEFPPDLHFIKTINMDRGMRVAMPWQYMIFKFNKRSSEYPLELGAWSFEVMHLLWRKTKLTNIATEYAVGAKIPNVDEYGIVCLGTTFPESNLPLAERIDTIVNEFYSPASLFNEDLTWRLPENYSTFLEWENDSADNPTCWKNWPEFDSYYEDYKVPLRDIIPTIPSISNSENGLNNLSFDQMRRRMRQMGATW